MDSPHRFLVVSAMCTYIPTRQTSSPSARSSVYSWGIPIPKGYKCYHPSVKEIITPRDVSFHEGKFYYQPELNTDRHMEDPSLDLSAEGPHPTSLARVISPYP